MNNSFVPWLIHMYDCSVMCTMTHSNVLWLIHVCHDSFMCVMTHSCVPWFIHLCHDSFICTIAHSCVPWLIHVWHDSFMCAMTNLCVPWLTYVRHDSFIRAICAMTHWETQMVNALFMCAMTHSCVDVISIWRLYLPGVEPGISRWLVGIPTARPWMLSSADESIHGLTVWIPLTTVKSRVRLPGDIISRFSWWKHSRPNGIHTANHREIPGSTPGRYNLQIEITSTSWNLADEVCAVWYSSGLPRSSQ